MKRLEEEMQRQDESAVLITAFKQSQGVLAVCCLLEEDHQSILDFELDAQKQSLLGLGKVINTGVAEVLQKDLVFVALTDMDFDWGRKPALLLKKGDKVVGEEVRDRAAGERLAMNNNVWFLHKNFAVYKDRIVFPQDIMNRICHFEIPWLPADWCRMDDTRLHYEPIVYASPTIAADLFLKERYFTGRNEKGLGTILIGVALS